MRYRVKVQFRGEGVALGDFRYLGGRYEWLSEDMGAWLAWLWRTYGVVVDERWTEIRRTDVL